MPNEPNIIFTRAAVLKSYDKVEAAEQGLQYNMKFT